MNILIAFEESQELVTRARACGHNAYSCDLKNCSGGHPEWHIKADAKPLLNGRCEFITLDGVKHSIAGTWDMIIAFPPCTHLATSGARHFARKRADGTQREAIELFTAVLNADCGKIAVENPMGIMSGGKYLNTHYPELCEKYAIPVRYTQKIQPWWYAADENDSDNYHGKTTCLWIKGLKKLHEPEQKLPAPERIFTSTGKSFPAWYCKISLRGVKGDRATIRSRTFPGVADAMAKAWF